MHFATPAAAVFNGVVRLINSKRGSQRSQLAELSIGLCMHIGTQRSIAIVSNLQIPVAPGQTGRGKA
jgi:hypothetical protein